MEKSKKNSFKGVLSILIGTLFGIGAFGVAISLLKSQDKIKESDIKEAGVQSLEKGPNDTITWGSIAGKPKKISPSDTKKSEFRLSKIDESTKIEETTPFRANSPIETLITGTRQEYFYNTGEWIPTIEKTISEFVNDPDWSSKLTTKGQREIDPLNTESIAEIAVAIKSLEPKLNKDLVKSAKEKIIKEVINPYIEYYNEKSQNFDVNTPDNEPSKEKNSFGGVGNPIGIANTAYIASIIVEDKKQLAEILNNSKEMISLSLGQLESFEMNPTNETYWQKEIKHIVLLSETLLATTSRKVNLYENINVQKVLMLPFIWGQTPPSQSISEILESRFRQRYAQDKKEIKNIGIPEENRILQVWANHKELKTKLEEPNLDALRIEIEKTAQFPPKSDRDKKNTFIINEKLENGKGFLGSYRLFENSWPTSIHITGDARVTADGSLGQPLPIIGGQFQRPEKINTSSINIIEDNENQLLIKINLLNAYNIEGLKKANRIILWDKVSGALHIKDSIAADRPLSLSTPIITEMEETPITVIKGSSELSATASITKNKQGKGFRNTVVELANPTKEGYIEYSIYLDQRSKLKHRDITIAELVNDKLKTDNGITENWMESYLTKKTGEHIPLWLRLVEVKEHRGNKNPRFFVDILLGDEGYLLMSTDTEYARNITLVNHEMEPKRDPAQNKKITMKDKALTKLVESENTMFEKNGLKFTDILKSESKDEVIESICSVYLTKPQNVPRIAEVGVGYVAKLKVTSNRMLRLNKDNRIEYPEAAGAVVWPSMRPYPYLVVTDEMASSLSLRHSGDGWRTPIPFEKHNGRWRLAISDLKLPSGVYEYKLERNKQREEGPARILKIISRDRHVRLSPKNPVIVKTKSPSPLLIINDPNTKYLALQHNQDRWDKEYPFKRVENNILEIGEFKSPIREGEKSEEQRKTIKFKKPMKADRIELRSATDNWETGHVLTPNRDPKQNTLEIDISKLTLNEGKWEYKFMVDGQLEEGPNRFVWIDKNGLMAIEQPSVQGREFRHVLDTTEIGLKPGVIEYKLVDTEGLETSENRVLNILEDGNILFPPPNATPSKLKKTLETSLGLWVSSPFSINNNIVTKEYKDILFTIEPFGGSEVKTEEGSSSLVILSNIEGKGMNTGWVLKSGDSKSEILEANKNKGAK